MTVDEKVLAAFYDIISESKQEMYDRIAADRTRYISVVMENIRKDHNASAVMRTCDCFGIQDLHTIEKDVEYVVQREIAKGASNWIDLHSHSTGENAGLECIDGLKKQGYQSYLGNYFKDHIYPTILFKILSITDKYFR